MYLYNVNTRIIVAVRLRGSHDQCSCSKSGQISRLLRCTFRLSIDFHNNYCIVVLYHIRSIRLLHLLINNVKDSE